MPKGDENGSMYGFQLWANLPSGKKMMDPRYRDIANNHIPEVTLPEGITIKIISGEVSGIEGPVKDIVICPEFFGITVPANTKFTYRTKPGHTVFAYVIEGQGYSGMRCFVCHGGYQKYLLIFKKTMSRY
jgi:quercetin 2,3-dioxygenase